MQRPLVIIGPSGAGKSTVANELRRSFGFPVIRTVTTRLPRSEDDTDHLFVTPSEFKSMEVAHQFLGTLQIFGQSYGLPFLPDQDKNLVLLRAITLKQFLESYPYAYIVQLEAPIDILVDRLKERGSEERADEVALQKEIEAGRSFAHLVLDSTDTIEAVTTKIIEGYLT